MAAEARRLGLLERWAARLVRPPVAWP